ncbi:EAL domain-containing protein [Chitinibacter sp. ZOR0017]|uniref:EAL domain-containing protein n=1 Tax=Chitinibacter sp. ZOR0017 TaxID=1339254 RepID=UPI0006483DD9|nr:EAL domain-containing protein [Chitinibacter sp. ZOR0017]
MSEPKRQTDIHVMLVDDSAVQLQYAASLCAEMHWTVSETADDGMNALLKLKSGLQIDLILLDLEMPGINGVGLLQELGRAQIDIPIVILSSREPALLESVANMGRQAGLTILTALQKPLRLEMLQNLLLQRAPRQNLASSQFSAAEIQTGINDNQFVIRYWPRFDPARKTVRALLAQLVWLHPEHGPLLQNQYAPQGCQERAFLQLYDHHLKNICTQLSTWAQQGLPFSARLQIPLALLSSPLQARTLINRLQDYALEPESLGLDINLHELDEEHAGTMAALNLLRLQNLPVGIQTAQLHLQWVKLIGRLPANEINLAAAVLNQLTQDPLAKTLLEHNILLAHSLGLQLNLSGFNEAKFWPVTQQLGVDGVDGPLINPGLSAEELLPWLRQQQGKPNVSRVIH